MISYFHYLVAFALLPFLTLASPYKGQPAGSVKDGQLPPSQMKVECKVSEAHIPVVGDMAWNFDMTVTGWGDKGSGCGGGILDNLRGSCHGTIISNWGCDKLGNNRLKLHFQTPKVHDGTCINAALHQASWQTWGQKALVCPYNYKSSTVKAVFSGLSMAIPIPGAGAVVGAAKAVGTAIVDGVKAGVSAVAKGATSLAKGVGQAGVKQAAKTEAKHVAKEGAKNEQQEQQQKHQQKQQHKRRRSVHLNDLYEYDLYSLD